MEQKSTQKIYIELVVATLVLFFCEWFFFRNIIGTEKCSLIGDRGDGRLTNLLTEHWWKFFNGKEKFSEIAMFYPKDDVFGYTDLFLGYGILYSFFRFIGLNMYVAYKWTLIVIHVMGTVSMYYLLKRKLVCNIAWSLFGTIAFCFSNTYAIHLWHTQLNAVAYLPLLLIFFIGFIENYEVRYKRNLYAYCFIVWFVLLTYNSWYIACFTGIFVLLFLIVYLIVLVQINVKVWIHLKEQLQIVGKDIWGYFVTLFVLYIPFIKVYIPAMKESAGYSYGTCVAFLPELADIINVTEGNLMLGRLIDKIGLSTRGYSGELTEGFSIVLLFFFGIVFWKNRKIYKNKIEKNTQSGQINIYIMALQRAIFISIIVSILLIIRWSANGVSLWWFVYTFVPIARSIRAIARFMFWLSFPMAVITAYMANKYIKLGSRVDVAIQVVAIGLIFLSNINIGGVDSAWNETDEKNFITNVSQPPEDVESFYIIDTSKQEDAEYIYQLDAFEIASWYGLKTINGYSGQMPLGWEEIWNPCSASYESGVSDWIKKYDLKNVYAYDRATNVWIPYEDHVKTVIDDVFSPADDKFSLSSGLEDWTKGDYAWTNQNFTVRIHNSDIKKEGLTIRMQTQLTYYLKQNPNLIPKLSIYIDGEKIKTIDVSDEVIELKLPMSTHESDEYTISIKTNCYFNPSDIGLNDDTRNLSVAVYYIGD